MQGETRSISFDGREIRLTTRRYAPQAGGSVLIECGDTAVLVTATRSNGREGIDFLPLADVFPRLVRLHVLVELEHKQQEAQAAPKADGA